MTDKGPVVATASKSVAGRNITNDRMALVTGAGSLSVNGPVPGKTYTIKDAFSEDVITLASGEVVLSSLGQRSNASTAWKCVASEGWVSFQNPVSGRFLGSEYTYNSVVCTADHVEQDQQWVPVLRSYGGFTLKLMRRIKKEGYNSTLPYSKLWCLGKKCPSSPKDSRVYIVQDEEALALEFRPVE